MCSARTKYYILLHFIIQTDARGLYTSPHIYSVYIDFIIIILRVYSNIWYIIIGIGARETWTSNADRINSARSSSVFRLIVIYTLQTQKYTYTNKQNTQ